MKSNIFPITFSIAAAALLVAPLMAAAADDKTQPSPQVQQPIGEETKAWLQLQNSGKQAANGPRPMPGEIADNVYQRYVDSFKQPIPAEFKRQSNGGSGNASGQ